MSAVDWSNDSSSSGPGPGSGSGSGRAIVNATMSSGTATAIHAAR